MLTAGVDAADPAAVRQFYIAHSRRLAMAGKILFPIPNRGVARRLYLLRAPTLIVWGAGDRLIAPVYAERWAKSIPGAKVTIVESQKPEVAENTVSGVK